MPELICICTVDLEQRLAEFNRMLRSLPPEVTLVTVLRGEAKLPPETAALLPANSHITTVEAASLSHARNVALDLIACLGLEPLSVVAFPDDDCTWDPRTADAIQRAFSRSEASLVIGRYRPWDADFELPRYPDVPGALTPRVILDRCASIVTFTRLGIALALRFDEQLGVGAPLPSGEDTDFALRVLALGGPGLYEPDIVCFHRYESAPDPRRRAVSGYIMARHLFRFPKLLIPLSRYLGRRVVVGPSRAHALGLVALGLRDAARPSLRAAR